MFVCFTDLAGGVVEVEEEEEVEERFIWVSRGELEMGRRVREREERDVSGKGGVGGNRKKANAEKGDLLWSEDGAY